jgi:hypothetical protein
MRYLRSRWIEGLGKIPLRNSREFRKLVDALKGIAK